MNPELSLHVLLCIATKNADFTGIAESAQQMDVVMCLSKSYLVNWRRQNWLNEGC